METTLRQPGPGSAPTSWWLYLLSGLLLIVLAFVAFRHPAGAYLSLSLWFAAIILMQGAAGLFFAYRHRHELPNWGWLLALGAGEVALGGYLLAIPAAALSTLAFFIGFWLLFRSLSTISHALALRRLGVTGWGWGLVSGLVGGLFGLLVLVNPGLGALGASLWLALALLALGLARLRDGVSAAPRRPVAAGRRDGAGGGLKPLPGKLSVGKQGLAIHTE